jgi:hypothetical protein
MVEGSAVLDRLKSALRSSTSVTTLVVCDRDGTVDAIDGDLDGEMGAAVAAHTAGVLDELGELMALGPVSSCSLGSPHVGLHVVVESQTVVMAVTKQLKNAEAVCATIGRELAGSGAAVPVLPPRVPHGR